MSLSISNTFKERDSWTLVIPIATLVIIIVLIACGIVCFMKWTTQKAEHMILPESTPLAPLNGEQSSHRTTNETTSLMHSKSIMYQNALVEESDYITNSLRQTSIGNMKEIPKNLIEVGNEIGEGNFGKVFIGKLNNMDEKSSSTSAAIKTIKFHAREKEMNSLLLELRIMSQLKPHLNLVSMLGANTSDLDNEGRMWLLLEYCRHGDLKTYIMEKKNKILSGREGHDPINNRCLITWTYDIAKGMQFLAENHIMHGDLAARNILIDEDPLKLGYPLAKVADFGLSKKFYDNVKYVKDSRLFVPWKWMAMEYLTKDFFTLTSDVWSFGVLLWEILSFGRNPYGHQGYDELLEKLENGYRLDCPKEVNQITSWSAKELFKNVSNVCFIAEPLDRASFSQVVDIIKLQMTSDEIVRYNRRKDVYDSKDKPNSS